LVERYSESSYMKTNVSQASVSFSFYGNGVQIFGAKRQNYSSYQISINSKTYPTAAASSSDYQGDFQASLFSTIALPVGYHNVQMTNMEQKTLDLDFITWQTPVGSDDGVITVITSQDSEPSFDYIPPSEWSSNVPDPGMFSGGSGHVTYTAGASVKFSFEGSAVQLYGPVGPNCAPYSVSLDGASPLNYSPNKPFYRSQQVLFQASHLADGAHSITIQSETGTNSTIFFAIDYVQVFSTSSSGSGNASLSVPQIVGIVIGSVCGFLLLGILIFVLLKKTGYSLLRKKKEGSQSNSGLVVEPYSGLQTTPATSPLYDTLAFSPQNLKGQVSHGTMVQRYSQPDQPLTASSFSGDNLYNQHDVSPFPLSPILSSSSPIRTPRILDEKRRSPSDGDSTSQATAPVLIATDPIVESSPPMYLK